MKELANKETTSQEQMSKRVFVLLCGVFVFITAKKENALSKLSILAYP